VSNINNNVAALFGNLFSRKTVEKVETPEERAAKLVESYKLDPVVSAPVVQKLATFEQSVDDAKADSKQTIEKAQKAIKDAEDKELEAKNVVNAAKAVGLRMRTLAIEAKAAKEKAEKAVEEAKAKIETLEVNTKQNKELGNQLLDGLTNPLLSLDMLANATEEEINALFGSSSGVKVPEKAADVKIV
jgi:hypothetical protein